jgi:hypothetical protein
MADMSAADPVRDTGTPMPKPMQIALGIYVIGMFVAIWPLTTDGSPETSNFFGGPSRLQPIFASC